jgi:hypothetical protein
VFELETKPLNEELLARLRAFSGTLPTDFRFGRNDANARGAGDYPRCA